MPPLSTNTEMPMPASNFQEFINSVPVGTILLFTVDYENGIQYLLDENRVILAWSPITD
jgi:hypothetical protein